MKRCKGVLLAGMLVLSMSVPVYADKSVVVKVEAPADTTDYYMTVDSGGVGVDIYPSTDGKGEKLNDKTVRDVQSGRLSGCHVRKRYPLRCQICL